MSTEAKRTMKIVGNYEDEIYTLRLALEKIKQEAGFVGGGSVIGNRARLLTIKALAIEALQDD